MGTTRLAESSQSKGCRGRLEWTSRHALIKSESQDLWTSVGKRAPTAEPDSLSPGVAMVGIRRRPWAAAPNLLTLGAVAQPMGAQNVRPARAAVFG
jgi:hypothetical protein